MMKPVKKGGREFTEILKHFCSQNSRNSDRSEGLQLQPSLLYKYDLYVTSS